jgi:predicted RNA-binding protein
MRYVKPRHQDPRAHQKTEGGTVMSEVIYDVTKEEAIEMSKQAVRDFQYTYCKPRIIKVNGREVIVEDKKYVKHA